MVHEDARLADLPLPGAVRVPLALLALLGVVRHGAHVVQALHRRGAHPRQARQREQHRDARERRRVHVVRRALLHLVPRAVDDAAADVLVQEEERREEGGGHRAAELGPERHGGHACEALRDEAPAKAADGARDGARHGLHAEAAHRRQRAERRHRDDDERRPEVAHDLAQLSRAEGALRDTRRAADEREGEHRQVQGHDGRRRVGAGGRRGAPERVARLVHEVEREQRVEDVVRELRAVLDERRRAAGREQEEQRRRPHADPAVHGHERQRKGLAELVQRHHERERQARRPDEGHGLPREHAVEHAGDAAAHDVARHRDGAAGDEVRDDPERHRRHEHRRQQEEHRGEALRRQPVAPVRRVVRQPLVQVAPQAAEPPDAPALLLRARPRSLLLAGIPPGPIRRIFIIIDQGVAGGLLVQRREILAQDDLLLGGRRLGPVEPLLLDPPQQPLRQQPAPCQQTREERRSHALRSRAFQSAHAQRWPKPKATAGVRREAGGASHASQGQSRHHRRGAAHGCPAPPPRAALHPRWRRRRPDTC
mmetsp:Transcript_3869/g.11188  ORF Transcript_3869/g.11188 Transcript_3869/m.11188 type:complete len:540 (-) Transcript_3869:152-1771(-)